MLQIKKLNMMHRKDSHVLAEDLDLVINDGDKAALIGEEGNGKSSLLKLIYDPALVDDYIDWSGEIVRGGACFAYLSQELRPEELDQSAAELCFGGGSESYEIYSVASELGLEPEMLMSGRKISSFSGGEKVKLRMAALLTRRPDVLLLDEPSNDIDLPTLEWLEDFIRRSPLTIIYISHDETLLERTAELVIHMEQLRRKTSARCSAVRLPYRRYVAERLAGFEKQEQMARSEKRDYDRQMERYRQIYQRVEHEQSVISRGDPHGGRLLKKKMHAVKSMGRRFEKEAEELTQMPESEEAIFLRFGENAALPAGKRLLSLALPELRAGEKRLCGEIALELSGSPKLCIVGQNGCGKTTLLRIIAEQLLHRKDIRAAYMPQNYDEGFDLSLSPIELLATGGSKDERTRVRSYLGSIKFTADEMSHSARELSGGQKAKLFFAKMALGDYNVLILDEPTRNLSPLSNPELRRVLKDFGGAIISVSHDRKFISEVCDRVLTLDSSGLHEA